MYALSTRNLAYHDPAMYVQTRALHNSVTFTAPRGMQMIPGTSVLLVADAGGQVIWAVNMHNMTAQVVAGNSSSRKDCFQQRQQLSPQQYEALGCSNRDGVGSTAEFATPYSVRLHAVHKYALVADTVNGALRVINLYTQEVSQFLSFFLSLSPSSAA